MSELSLDAAPALSRRGYLAAAGGLAPSGDGALQLAGAAPAEAASVDQLPSRARIVAAFEGHKPKKFGMFLSGMIMHGHRRVSLTFDACGGPRGSRYDSAVIKTLRKRKVPATLFLNARWIEANRTLAQELASDPLFELANHGLTHRPLTVRGQSAYGIAGTRSAGEVYDEIVGGMEVVAELTGVRSRCYRPGTAWADDVGISVARHLGVRVVSFSVNADEGATASKSAVIANLKSVRSKDIVLAHVNQPDGKTAEGLAAALPVLVRKDLHFTTLSKSLA